jgi:predicted dehydrogenase
MERLRVGIVGCGEVAQIIHLPSLYRLVDRFQVTALCDVSQQVLDGVGDRWSVTKRFLRYQDLLDQPDVDVVLVASPHAYHTPVTLAGLDAGKHVLVEKPMSLSLAEADAVIAAQQQSGLVVQVGTMRRYAPAFLQACRTVAEWDEIHLARVHDVIGHNRLIIEKTSRVIRGNDIPPSVVEEGRALEQAGVKAAIGDAPADLRMAYMLMLGLSSHDLSAMRELLGMPKGVLQASQRRGGIYQTATFDYGSYVCQFDTGVDFIPRFDCFLEVYTTDKVLRVQYDTPYVVNLPIRLILTEANGENGVIQQEIHPSWGDAFVLEWEAFYDSVMNRQIPKTSPADFRLDLELFQWMIQAMRDEPQNQPA